MERNVGTVVRGIRTPIIKEGDNLSNIVVDFKVAEILFVNVIEIDNAHICSIIYENAIRNTGICIIQIYCAAITSATIYETGIGNDAFIAAPVNGASVICGAGVYKAA